MLDTTRAKLIEIIGPDDVVLDIGGWGDPFGRADWVVDLFPYETRGLYERKGWVGDRGESERFSADTWLQRDICEREPLPFADDQFDFVICSHTLEDIRDPIWVCSEIQRVGKAGYIEVPSRLEEQSYGVVGDFVGWSHHHWLIDGVDGGLDFVFKPHVIHALAHCQFPAGFWETLTDEEKVVSLWWEGSFPARERVFFEQPDEETLDQYLHRFVEREMAVRGVTRPKLPLHRRVRARAHRALQGSRA